MPTAVNVAKQYLTAESSYALQEAVNVARRRGNSQTTSLHAVSALLSLPNSVLREACARVRNSAYSPRLQFKALDLCLSVSLDRIQSSHPPGSDDPPVSNSLMAAIKRSQAHQRRLPENFRLYQEMSQNQNSLSCVKVELRQLMLSILDDPVVSRVFGEAGFRSSELKFSIIRPIPHLLRYSSPRGQQQQPLFLCNVTGNHHEPELNPVRPCLPHRKSSLMGSFVPFGGFFSTPDLKLPLSGFNKDITGPVSSISDHTQSTLPPWLQMTTRTDLNQKSGSKVHLLFSSPDLLISHTRQMQTKEGLESVGGTKLTSSASASTGSAKLVTTDLNLKMYPVTTGFGLKKHFDNKVFSQTRSASSSILENPRELNVESFKIIYQRLTDRVSGQDEAAKVISCALSQPPTITTRRDVWLNLVGPDTVSKRRMSLVLSEIVYQSEHRFMPVDLGVAEHGMNGCDDVMWLRGKTMVDHIFEVLCRNPFCVVFLENIDKADEKLQISLSKAIETGKFMDSHGREVGIGNTTFVMTSSLVEDSEEKLLRAKGKQMEIWIETVSMLPNVGSISSMTSVNKRKMIGLGETQDNNETVETIKRLNRTTNGVLDLNLPAQETESEETDHSEENSKLWLVNLKKHDRLVEVPFKPFDFEGLAERIKKSVKEMFDKCVRSDCLLEIDPKIMERLLAAVYFSDGKKDIIKELMEKVMARVFLHVKERYEITSSCVVKLVGRDLDIIREDQMELFLVKSQ